jgi:xanthosine utilization system XapX-like protein
MHDTRHLRTDLRALAEHLGDCAFNASPEEQYRNLKSLEAHDIYITDVDTREISLKSVTAWRKTATLLRHTHEWNAAEPRVLSQEEMEILAEIEGAHARKTRLAVDIIRMLDTMRHGGDQADALSAVTDILDRVSHGNRRNVAQLEEQVQAKLDADLEPAKERPLRITSGQLQEYLKKIESYFLVEYRLLLERVSRLTAKSVIHAGDLADHRIDELKSAGFEGLGTIRPLSAHRILRLFLSVAFGGFLIYYVLWYDAVIARLRSLPTKNFTEAQLALIGQNMLIGIGFFVTAIAFASLIGALFGSSSANARGKETPWGRYFLAGIAAVATFFILQMIREVVLHALSLGPAAAQTQANDSLSRIRLSSPWSVLPFLIAVTVCWLARQSPWQLPNSLSESTGATLERALDGVVMGVLMLPGFMIAVALLLMAGQELPLVMRSRFDPPVMAILGILGFLVGAVVVRDVRLAAHAQVVALKPRKATAVVSKFAQVAGR